MKISTGLADFISAGGSLLDAFNGGLLKVYHSGGTPPATADAAAVGTLLWTISKDGNSTLTFEGRPGERGIFKPVADTWSGPTTAGAMPDYWRLVAAGDDGAASSTQARCQGTAGTSPTAEMQLADTAFVANASPTARALSRFGVAMPLGS